MRIFLRRCFREHGNAARAGCLSLRTATWLAAVLQIFCGSSLIALAAFPVWAALADSSVHQLTEKVLNPPALAESPAKNGTQILAPARLRREPEEGEKALIKGGPQRGPHKGPHKGGLHQQRVLQPDDEREAEKEKKEEAEEPEAEEPEEEEREPEEAEKEEGEEEDLDKDKDSSLTEEEKNLSSSPSDQDSSSSSSDSSSGRPPGETQNFGPLFESRLARATCAVYGGQWFFRGTLGVLAAFLRDPPVTWHLWVWTVGGGLADVALSAMVPLSLGWPKRFSHSRWPGVLVWLLPCVSVPLVFLQSRMIFSLFRIQSVGGRGNERMDAKRLQEVITDEVLLGAK